MTSLLIAVAWLIVVSNPQQPDAGPGLCPSQELEAEAWVFDFEEAGLARSWTAGGPIRAARRRITEPPSATSYGGHVLEISAQGGAGIYTRPDTPLPELDRQRAFSFWINARDVRAGQPLVLEIRFAEVGRPAWLWRKVEVDAPGWQRIEIPLMRFRPKTGVSVDWDDVRRFGFTFRNDGDVAIDTIRLVSGDGPDAADLSLEQLRRDAFGDAEDVRVRQGDTFAVLTDDPGLDLDALMAALDTMADATRVDFPDLSPIDRPVPLVVFARETDYRNFWPQFAEAYNAEIAEPTADGFTALGIATTSSGDDPGHLRPVMIHEAHHALWSQISGLGNTSAWLAEGLAVRYQLRYMNRSLDGLIDRIMAGRATVLPWTRLTDGRPITTSHYWQAASVIAWMLDDPQRRPAFHRALEQMRIRCSTDLRPLAEPIFGQSLQSLEEQWVRDDPSIEGTDPIGVK